MPNKKLKNNIGWLLAIFLLCCYTIIFAAVKNKNHKTVAAIKPKIQLSSKIQTHSQVTSINFAVNNQQTTLIFDLTGDIPAYKVYSLSKPPRLIVDLPNVTLLHHNLNNINFNGSPILHVRASRPTPTLLRLAFDLDEKVQPETLLQKIPNETTKKLIIDFTFKSIPHPAAVNTNIVTAKPKNNLQQTQQWLTESLAQNDNTTVATNNNSSDKTNVEDDLANATATKVLTDVTKTTQAKTITVFNNPEATMPTGDRLITIVIDPGHGGKDPGTTGPLGVHEKDVVLAISKDLREILASTPGFHPVLTRDSDYFIPLRGRLAIARKYKGDMFIAIHADAYSDPYASGASVYALSPHGASTEAARWLAEKENFSELGGINLTDKSDMLRSVLLDLSQTATISSSMQVGQSLLQQLNKVGQLHYTVVEQAPFMVLKSPDIPSVLVETGFLSNTFEEERLRNPMSQIEIAKALANGIENYFWKNPPPGTYIAVMAAKKTQ